MLKVKCKQYELKKKLDETILARVVAVKNINNVMANKTGAINEKN
jgi:hypothetical protein